jgi:hypothetical protein
MGPSSGGSASEAGRGLERTVLTGFDRRETIQMPRAFVQVPVLVVANHTGGSIMARSIRDVAREIAEAHIEEDPGIQTILVAEDTDDQEIFMIEVSGSVAEVGEVFPFRYKAQKGTPYPLALVLLHPSDWRKIEVGELELPKDFENLDEFDEIHPRAA